MDSGTLCVCVCVCVGNRVHVRTHTRPAKVRAHVLAAVRLRPRGAASNERTSGTREKCEKMKRNRSDRLRKNWLRACGGAFQLNGGKNHKRPKTGSVHLRKYSELRYGERFDFFREIVSKFE